MPSSRGAECRGSFDGQACRMQSLTRKCSSRFAACANLSTGRGAECKVLLMGKVNAQV